jgi:hypothetical protein
MGQYFEQFDDDDDEWLSDIETTAIDLQSKLSDWRQSRQRERLGPARGTAAVPRRRTAIRRVAVPGPAGLAGDAADDEADAEEDSGLPGHAVAASAGTRPHGRPAGRAAAGRQRTRTLIDRGRRSADPMRGSRARKMALWIAAAAALLIGGLMLALRPGPSWPASVSLVRSEIGTACQNPNVASEPDQVNFACGKDTSQVLWVFSLLTSDDNPAYSDPKTGRKGLEPISPAQGGEVAWSLDLHHPYNPYDPIDSLAVAARAINNIIGGATLTSATGSPSVQPGLESSPANCARYTGSPAVVSRAGYPSVCAQPVTSAAGQAALVSDVYRAWFVGAPAADARDAAVLFQNANDPGNPQVQAILKSLSPQG